MNLNSILHALKHVSRPQDRAEVLSVAEQKLNRLGKRLNALEEEWKQLDELVQMLKKMQ